MKWLHIVWPDCVRQIHISRQFAAPTRYFHYVISRFIREIFLWKIYTL
nr:MAG TPA: hypothetical protein [Caudoviricetes sp.]